jgi:putative aldouronate transport system substrate-binding protein
MVIKGGAGKDDPGRKSNPSSSPAPVTLRGMLFNQAPRDLPMILKEFERRTKDTLNTKLDIEWNMITDHKHKVKMRMALGEEVDFLFDAPWTGNLFNMVNQGAYAKLDKYFNNDEYPGLQKAFPNEVLENNKRPYLHDSACRNAAGYQCCCIAQRSSGEIRPSSDSIL